MLGFEKFFYNTQKINIVKRVVKNGQNLYYLLFLYAAIYTILNILTNCYISSKYINLEYEVFLPLLMLYYDINFSLDISHKMWLALSLKGMKRIIANILIQT